MSELTVDIPAHILHQPCTDRDQSTRLLMVGISRKTTIAFKMLGRLLSVEESELNAIEEENTGHNSTQERKYQVLLKWVSAHGQNATIESLIGALVAGEDRQAVEFVCDKVHPRDSVTRSGIGDSSYTVRTPQNSGPIRILPSPFGTAVPSTSSSVSSTPAHHTGTPSSLIYQPGLAESLSQAVGKVVPKSTPTTATGIEAQPGSTPADSVAQPNPSFGLLVSDQTGQEPSLVLPSTTAVETSFGADMTDLSAVRPGCKRPSTLPVNSPQVPFGVQATKEESTPFDSMPRCSHGIGRWLQHQMEQEIRKFYSQIDAISCEYTMLKSQVDTLTIENKFYKESIQAQREKIRELTVNSCHVENSKLKTELELHENLLSLICQSLKVSKEELLKACNLEVLSAQLGMMIKSASDQSHDVQRTVMSLHADYNRLWQQKLELEGKLDGVISLFTEKLFELKAVIEEKKELQAQSESTISKLREEVCSTRKFWVDKNKELEAKVAALENLNKELMEKNQKLQEQNEKLMENKLNVVASKEVLSGFCRSVSDGSYRLVALENLQRASLHTGSSVDEGLKKLSLQRNQTSRKVCVPSRGEEMLTNGATGCYVESEFDEDMHKQLMENILSLIASIDDNRSQLSAGAQGLQERINEIRES